MPKEVPIAFATWWRGFQVEDERGDPIAISHPLIETMVKRFKGELIVHQSERGTIGVEGCMPQSGQNS